MAEREKPKVQFGISTDADFDQNEWKFTMIGEYAVWAGEFAILEADKYRKLAEQNKELLEALKEIEEVFDKMKTIGRHLTFSECGKMLPKIRKAIANAEK